MNALLTIRLTLRPIPPVRLGALFLAALLPLAAQNGKVPNDPDAKALLKQIRESDSGWDENFPGFRCAIEVFMDGTTHRGKLEVRARDKIEVTEMNDKEAQAWAERSIRSIVSSAYRTEFESRYEKLGVTFGKDDLNPLGQLLHIHGDRFRTSFRIRDGEVRQIVRSNSARTVTIDILHLERDAQGRKTAQIFATQYFDIKTKALERAETVQEGKIMVGDHLLPHYYHEILNQNGGSRMRSVRFFRHELGSADRKAKE